MRKFYIALLILLVVFSDVIINKCTQFGKTEHPPKAYDSIPYFKAKLAYLESHVTVEYVERVKYRTKFNTIRHDSMIPCETKLLTCDTLILKDDSLINDLLVKDTVNTRFNMYLVNRIKTDSIVLSDTCKYFGKEIKKQKWIKRLIIAAWIGREAVGVVR